MVKRKKIGLIYQYNENWIGGTYYIQNLIFALNRLDNDEKPILIIICEDIKAYNDLKKATNYPFMVLRGLLRKPLLCVRIINKFSRIFFFNNIFKNIRYNNFTDIDILFPAIEHDAFIKVKYKLFWLPDLQEHFYPDFFTKDEIEFRLKQQKNLIVNNSMILFSSKTALNHFNQIYGSDSNQKFVLPFTVNINHVEEIVYSDIRNKYNIVGDYFICCNQFWQHKNHIVIFDALRLLKNKGIAIQVILTGKEADYRDSSHFQKLKERIKELNVEENIKFLGFINRVDQIELLKNSIAVIQPSLFEGWSTIVEDAKALNIILLCSDIPVHKEQLEDYPNKFFFQATNPIDLGQKIQPLIRSCKKVYYNYEVIQYQHSKALKDIIQSICN